MIFFSGRSFKFNPTYLYLTVSIRFFITFDPRLSHVLSKYLLRSTLFLQTLKFAQHKIYSSSKLIFQNGYYVWQCGKAISFWVNCRRTWAKKYIKYLLKLDGFCFTLLPMVKFTDKMLPKKTKPTLIFKRNYNLYGTLKVAPLCIEKIYTCVLRTTLRQ